MHLFTCCVVYPFRLPESYSRVFVHFQLFYLGFLMFYSYVVLVKMPELPSPQEWVVILYIFASAVEKIREVSKTQY